MCVNVYVYVWVCCVYCDVDSLSLHLSLSILLSLYLHLSLHFSLHTQGLYSKSRFLDDSREIPSWCGSSIIACVVYFTSRTKMVRRLIMMHGEWGGPPLRYVWWKALLKTILESSVSALTHTNTRTRTCFCVYAFISPLLLSSSSPSLLSSSSFPPPLLLFSSSSPSPPLLLFSSSSPPLLLVFSLSSPCLLPVFSRCLLSSGPWSLRCSSSSATPTSPENPSHRIYWPSVTAMGAATPISLTQRR